MRRCREPQRVPTGLLIAVLWSCVPLTVNAPTLYVDLNNPSPVAPYTNWITAATNIQDAVDAASPADTILVTNGVYQTGGRVVYGSLTNRVVVNKAVTVQSVNGPTVTAIEGYQPPGTTNGDSAVRCLYLASGAVLSGFTLTNGATRTSGSADIDMSGGGVWCDSAYAVLTNCVLTRNAAAYWAGGAYFGTLNNCLVASNVNFNASPAGGGGAYLSVMSNCTLSGNRAGFGGGAYNATLNNCTLAGNSVAGPGGAVYGGVLNFCTVSNNWALGGGGGAWAATLNNCLITSNSTPYSGGGANNCTLNNCLVTSNWAQWYGGGGAYRGTLNNCTVVGNSSSIYPGGGANSSALTNCIVYYNTAPSGANYSGPLNHCCTTPLPGGVGNITNAPLFVNPTDGNFHLQASSPCINAGSNAFAPPGSDLDGNPRIAGGTVDIGAYEVQAPSSLISCAWLLSYGLPTDGSADHTDGDGDRMDNWQEWIAGTNPTNALSVLRLGTPTGSLSGITLSWQSVSGKTYYLQRSTNLVASLAFSLLQSNLPGLPGTTSFTDTNPPASGPAFYRVGVQP